MSDAQIKITADTRQAQKAIDDLDKSLSDINKTGMGAGRALAGITAAAAAIGYTVLKTLESAGQLIDAANALGIAAQNLQVMQHAAATTGVSADELNSSLMRLNNNIGTALINGTGGATDALKRLGIPLSQIATLRTDEQFKRLATEINKIPSAAERSAVAMDLFGKQGPKMLALADNIAKVDEKLTKMGLKLTDLDVAALDQAGDAVDELVSLFGSALKKAVVDIAPYIIAIVEAIKDAIVAAGGFDKIWGVISGSIKYVIDLMLLVGAIKLASGAIALASGMMSAAKAATLFNDIVKRNPLMLAVGAALALSKILGFDVTGALWDMAGMSDRVDDANKSIAASAAETAKKNSENLELTKGLNKEQQKLVDALEDTIAKLGIEARYSQDILTYGEEEAKIKKVIAEEQGKLAKAGLSLTADQEKRLRLSQQEVTTADALAKNRQRIKEIEQGQLIKTGNADADVLKAEEELAKARQNLQRATSDVSRQEAQRQVSIHEKAVKDSINWSIVQTSSTLKAFADQNIRINQLDTALINAKKAGYTEDSIAYRTLLADKAIAEQEYQNSIMQMTATRIQQQLMMEKNLATAVLSNSDQAVLQKMGEQERLKVAVANRIEFEKKSDAEKYAFGLEQGAMMFSALGAQNKKAFEAAKAFNIANAIMNTYLSATKALAMYPPPFSFIAAAAAVAMGMGQVAQIRSQQYSGRALGGPVMGGETYMVGENGPELFTPSTTGSITRNDQLGGGGTNINFTIQANDAAGFDQLLLERKGMIQQFISDAMLERGQRSKM